VRNAELNARLSKANPVPMARVPAAHRSFSLGRTGRVLLAILAALLLGVGVAWAASGTNPIASVFADDLKVVESDLGFDSFEILQPVTEEDLSALPLGTARAAVFLSTSRQTAENTKNGLPPFGRDKSRFDPDPAMISAIGRGETNTGRPVTLLVSGGEVCAFTGKNGFGRIACGDVESIAEGRAFTWGSQINSLLGLTGIYNDDVAAIDVLEDSEPPIEIPDNVLELRDLRYQDITLVGLGDEGNELFRREAPLSMKS